MLGTTFSSSQTFEIGIFSIKCRRNTRVFSSAVQFRRSFFTVLLLVVPSARHSFLFSPKLNFQLNRHTAIRGLLVTIQEKISTSATNPWISLNTLRSERVVSAEEVVIASGRVGVFPLAGNPIHWGHLITCLFAVAEFSLDTMVLLPAGKIDYKPVLGRDDVSETHRVEMIRLALEPFQPLLRYTDVARGTANPGEAAVHDLRRLNPNTPLDLTLIWGSESIERVQRIVRQAAESLSLQPDLLERTHSISLAFIKGRDALNEAALTEARLSRLCDDVGLNVPCLLTEFDSPVLRTTQSTLYRDSLRAALVPRSVHEYVIQNGLYRRPD